jgi:predicted nucleic acid-binding Zn finger protein
MLCRRSCPKLAIKTCITLFWGRWHAPTTTTARVRSNGPHREPDDVRERGERARPCRPATCPSLRMLSAREASRCVQHAELCPPPSLFAPSTVFARCVAANPELWEQLELLCPEALPLAAEILDHKTIIRCVARDSKREFYTVSASAKQLHCCIPGWCSCNSYAFEVLGSRKLVCKHELAVLVASAIDDRVHTNVLDDEKWVRLQVDVGVWDCPRPGARWGTAQKGRLHAGPPASPSGLANYDPCELTGARVHGGD